MVGSVGPVLNIPMKSVKAVPLKVIVLRPTVGYVTAIGPLPLAVCGFAPEPKSHDPEVVAEKRMSELVQP
jgi:hypothetical protein